MFNLDELKYGVYAYKVNDRTIYIGRDSDIQNNSRYYDHLKPSKYNVSKLNKYLQDNDDWEYEVLACFRYKNAMCLHERYLIGLKRPKFNKIKGSKK